ncbi:serine protease 58-like isoform X1 [Talpa occidentalis]|uniref:serine protease 58-like isoform X1 n=1 Tax=Talpa occidentalis TaxID=50954 RepID=UPI00188E9EA6|nr:serine protease 58-like isoform X1 [Talpa occidentalis]
MKFSRLLKVDIASKEISLNKTDKLIPEIFLQHPNFTMDTPDNNLMLIKLNVPLKLKQVSLAVLPDTMDDREGEKCTVFAWGWSEWNYLTGLEPDIQMNRNVFFLPNALCQAIEKSVTIQMTKKMFCAGSNINTISLCKEMSAAPILCQNQLYGILSWSKGCALRGDVGYYTKISHYTDWILNVIRTY